MRGSARITYLTGVRLKAHGRTWGELATNVVEQLAVVSTAQGTTITLTRAPRSWSRWILRRDQVLIGVVRRRWGGTWDGFDRCGRRLIFRAATRQEAVHVLLDHAGHDR